METVEPVPPSTVRRAAAIARGPHACPGCECPTFAEPPVPWTGLRDYLVRCDACERPILVRVDRDRLLRRGSGARQLQRQPGMYDAVDELLGTPGRHAFWVRLGTAAILPLLVASLALAAGGGNVLRALVLATVAVLPGALWGPGIVATVWGEMLVIRRRADAELHRRGHRRQVDVVEVGMGRWDQWGREQRCRQREREEQPEAVLRELERVLDERELRRIRALAVRGEVPPAALDDLLRFRRSWTSVA